MPLRIASYAVLRELAWDHRVCNYIFEYRRHNTPKSVEDAALKVERAAARENLSPMVIAPYLDEKKLIVISDQERFSWAELCLCTLFPRSQRVRIPDRFVRIRTSPASIGASTARETTDAINSFKGRQSAGAKAHCS